MDGERKTHPRHFDTQALITMVVSLSSYGLDFEGGLYVSTGGNVTGDKFIAMQSGDAVGGRIILITFYISADEYV